MNNSTSGIYPEERMRKWDAIVHSGWLVSTKASTWAIAIALMTLLYQAVAVRLFHPYTMGLFWLISEDQRSWDVDQFRVAMANTKSPISALVSTPAYRVMLSGIPLKPRRVRGIALLWLLGALVLTVIPFFLPLLLARGIPVVSGVPGSTDYCGPMLIFGDWVASAQYDKLLSLDVLRSVDTGGFNFSGTDATSVGLTNTKDRVMVSADCPEWAPVCDRRNPLRVDVDFWIKPSELGVGSRAESDKTEFGVLNTCYKVEARGMLLRTEQDGSLTYGLLYGPSNSTGEGGYVTDIFTPEERFGYGYNLFSHFNLSGNSTTMTWSPNDTMLHDGDRTLLFYHIGSILSNEPSEDPIFWTNSTPIKKSYYYVRPIVPVMCNTTYSYCPSEGGDCISLGGNEGVGEYIFQHSDSGYSKGLGFLELMWINTWIPLFFTITGSSESVYASRTLSLGATQLSPREIHGHAEIIRLALAGRMLLLTSAVRAVSGWRDYVLPGLSASITGQTEEQLDTCRLTLMERSGYITTTAWAILIVVLVGGILLLCSFTGPLLRYFLWNRLCVLTIRWRLRTAPHLHRTTIECGNPSHFWPGGAADEWPVGKGYVDRVGLVEGFTGYHAVYRYDAELRYEPKHGSGQSDPIFLTDNSL